MKIDIYSDAHIDTWGGNFDFIPYEDDCTNVIALLAGDSGNYTFYHNQCLEDLKKRYKDAFGIPGNHEWYREGGGVNVDETRFVVEIDGLKIVGATLWSNFRCDPITEFEASQSINDFRLILGMSPTVMTKMYNDDKAFLLDHKDADIVVTHFPPIIQSVHPKYAGDRLNGYFVNDDEKFFTEMSPKVWVHGHTHSRFDYEHLGVRVVSNPRGYPNENYKKKEYPGLRIEVQ